MDPDDEVRIGAIEEILKHCSQKLDKDESKRSIKLKARKEGQFDEHPQLASRDRTQEGVERLQWTKFTALYDRRAYHHAGDTAPVPGAA